MTDSSAKPLDIAFGPHLYTALEKAQLEKKRAGKSILVSTGFKNLDLLLNPLETNDLGVIHSRPGHGKTSFLNALARSRSKFLYDNREKFGENRVVAYVTGEQAVEELSSFHTAAEAHIDTRVMKRGEMTDKEYEIAFATIDNRFDSSLWFFGHSDTNRRLRPRLSIEFIIESLLAAEKEYKLVYDLVIVDYLQVLPLSDPRVGFTEGFSRALHECKDGTRVTGCPWWVGAQTNQKVDERNDPTPQLGDIEYVRGAAGQIADTMLSSIIPWKYKQNFGRYEKKKNTIVFTALKQKLADTGEVAMTFDPRYNKLEEADELRYAFKKDPFQLTTKKPIHGGYEDEEE